MTHLLRGDELASRFAVAIPGAAEAQGLGQAVEEMLDGEPATGRLSSRKLGSSVVGEEGEMAVWRHDECGFCQHRRGLGNVRMLGLCQ